MTIRARAMSAVPRSAAAQPRGNPVRMTSAPKKTTTARQTIAPIVGMKIHRSDRYRRRATTAAAMRNGNVSGVRSRWEYSMIEFT